MTALYAILAILIFGLLVAIPSVFGNNINFFVQRERKFFGTVKRYRG